MNPSSARLRRAFALVVAIGVAVLGGVAWTIHEQSVRLDETAGWADRTRAGVAAVHAVSLAALDAESGERSYLLGSPSGLARYRDAVASARRNLDIVARQAGDDPEQVQLVAGLRMAVEAHFARLDKAVALTPDQPAQARAIALGESGRQSRRDIQSFASAVIATEGHRYDERIVAARDVRHAVETWAAVLLLLLVTAMGGGAILSLIHI